MPYIGRHLDRGNYLKLDDISSSFDGVETTFNLTNGGSPFYPGSAFSILVVLAGVIQEAESAYQIDQSQITFASAPLASDSFFCIVLGTALGINVPGNGTVGGTQLTKPFSYDGFFYLNDTTNRVGINSSSPTTALDVQGNVTATQFVGNISNTSGISTFYNLTVENDLTVNGSFSTLDTIVTEVDKLEVGANNSTVGVAITQSGSGDILRLYDSSTQVVTVADGGNVGIGTNNPSGQLTLYQTNNDVYASTTRNYEFLSIQNKSTTSGSRVGFELLVDGVGNASVANISAIDAGGGFTDFAIGLRNSNVYQEKVRITSAGNVGIGTDNPGSKLHIISTNNVPARFESPTADSFINFVNTQDTNGYIGYETEAFTFYTNNTEKLRITSGGQVGVGTNPNNGSHSSLNRLHVYGPSTVGTHVGHIMLSGDSAVVGEGPQIVFSESGHTSSFAGGYVGFLREGSNSQGSLVFGTRGETGSAGTAPTERLRITSSGNVGIGTDNPFSTNGTNLEVAHHTSSGACRLLLKNTNGSGLRYYIQSQNDGSLTFGDISNGERLRINSSGNIGINTTTPADTLDVNGNVLPSFDATHDLGSASKRWNNVYTTDLQLSNEGSSNDVDGSWGRWTIQEGEDDLFLINRRNGKKYKFVLQEVN